MGINAQATFSQFPGGLFLATNVTAAAVIKPTTGVIMRVIVTTPGTAGNLTINNNASTSTGNALANQLISIPFGSLTIGQVLTLEANMSAGITVSSVTTGGVFSITYS